MVATAENLIGIEFHWNWINENLLNELEELEDLNEKLDFALSKLQSLVNSQDQNTEEKSSDPKFRVSFRVVTIKASG